MTVVGIDLGTTNSLVAYWNGSEPKIISNILGSNLTPSVVSVDDNGEIYVGEIAKERLITHPDLTAAAFKRYMGTGKVYHLGKYSFTAEELSSFVLRSLKCDAEAFLGQEVLEAIISVPAYFNDTQRKATKRAAELAGLKVERLISEPTAAAISYGLHEKNPETKFLVFDLGGGTFDVSVLEIFENIMEVKSIAGDNFLGGEDFTNLLMADFIKYIGFELNSLNSKEYSSLYKQAELCKHQLSLHGSGKISAQIINEMKEKTITREEFASLVSDLLLRIRHPVERALKDADITPQELDAIILIGGATRMPVIRSAVSKMFNQFPFYNINPDEAVALGAAIQGALKERDKALEEVILTDVCPYTLGTNVARYKEKTGYESGHFFPIIERNTPIPVSRVERLYTIYDNQAIINIEVYQGESRKVINNIKLGELDVIIPPSPAGEQAVDVRYTYDINGILEVEVTVVGVGTKKQVLIEKNPGNLTDEEIEARMKALQQLKIHPRDKTENKLLLARGERLYEELRGEDRAFISEALNKFESVIDMQDERKVSKAAAELKKILDEVERRLEF